MKMSSLGLKLSLFPLAIKELNVVHKEESYIVQLQIVSVLSLNSEMINFQELQKPRRTFLNQILKRASLLRVIFFFNFTVFPSLRALFNIKQEVVVFALYISSKHCIAQTFLLGATKRERGFSGRSGFCHGHQTVLHLCKAC